MQVLELKAKTCTKCKKYKALTEFNKHSGCKDNLHTQCKSCLSSYLAVWRKNFQKNITVFSYLKKMISHTRYRAELINKDFNIIVDDLIELYGKQAGLCAISKEKLTWIAGKGVINTNISIDRIDNNKGYTKDNIHLVCVIINRMKLDMSMEEFISRCDHVVKYNLPIKK